MKRILAFTGISLLVLLMIMASLHSGGPADFLRDSYVKARLLFVHGSGAPSLSSWPNAEGTESVPPWNHVRQDNAVDKVMDKIRRMR